MDPLTIRLDAANHRLRRVGRLARRRMRIEGPALRDGVHTDGVATIVLSGIDRPAAGAPETFHWEADRPIALVIVRSGIDGDDVTFHVGPSTSGEATGALVGDGSGLRYVAFCYDAEPVAASEPLPIAPRPVPAPRPAAPQRVTTPRIGERRSILGLVLKGGPAPA